MRTLVVDDNDEFRERFVEYLNELRDVEVIGEARDGVEAIEQSDALNPELIFLDLSMPRLNGFEAMKRIRQRHANSRIVIVTIHDEPAFKQFARLFRADGFVNKGTIRHDVPLAVKHIIDARETSRKQAAS
jgi:two-component system invasion response regulator UvrY